MAPASIPPNSRFAGTGPASVPPTYPPTDLGFGQPVPPRRIAEPSMSMPRVAGPRWGLIIMILLFDAGLATAGAIMLQRGLAKPDAVAPPPSPKQAQAAAVDDAPKPVEAPKPKDVSASILAAANGSGSAAGSASAPPVKPKVVAKSKSGPEDPYSDAPAKTNPPLAAEVELSIARSRGELDRCRDDAGDIHGRIDIGFTVLPTGAVDDLKIQSNTTGSQVLATCLVGVLTHWAFAARPATGTHFVRPFIY